MAPDERRPSTAVLRDIFRRAPLLPEISWLVEQELKRRDGLGGAVAACEEAVEELKSAERLCRAAKRHDLASDAVDLQVATQRLAGRVQSAKSDDEAMGPRDE